MVVFAIPFTLILLGLFLLVMNAAMLGFTALLVPGLFVAGCGSALVGSSIVSIPAALTSWYIRLRGYGRGSDR